MDVHCGVHTERLIDQLVGGAADRLDLTSSFGKNLNHHDELTRCDRVTPEQLESASADRLMIHTIGCWTMMIHDLPGT